MGAEFLAQHYPVHTVLLPNPTWANHNKIFPLAGIKDVRKYRYFKPATKGLDYEVCSTPSSPLSLFQGVLVSYALCSCYEARELLRQLFTEKLINAFGTWKAIQLVALVERALEGGPAG